MVVAVAESYILITGTYESSRVAWLQRKKKPPVMSLLNLSVVRSSGEEFCSNNKKGPQIPF